MKRYFILFFLAIFFYDDTKAQCLSTITTFPYVQDFETGTNGWSSGGTNNSWAWGSPAKSFILSAGSGTKCWVTGGLTGSQYNNGERSYVVSPCFDFTSLSNPHISFKIFWESEYLYDGTTFQYSLNGGTTWANVGSDTDPVDCLNSNWFNTSNIQYLTTLASPKQGWSGSMGGNCTASNGSNGWVVAQHCLSSLGGQSSVQFRFAFGAGTTCNGYDGFAFDQIVIGEAPPNQANFSYNCTGTNLEYQFNNLSILCPTSYSWNFGDPASGGNNTSSASNPTHIFSSPGAYTVSLTVAGPCNASSTITHTVQTIQGNANVTQPLCGQTNGAITSTSSNTSGAVNYTLLPLGSSNATGLFSSVIPGTYTVQIHDANNCVLDLTASVLPSATVNINSVNSSDITCFGQNNGSIQFIATGGIGTITYLLQPGATSNTTGIFTSLAANTYTVVASDASGCSVSSTTVIHEPPLLVFTSFAKNDCNCFGYNDGQAAVQVTGGTGSITYTLLPLGMMNSTGIFQNLTAGNYIVVAKDANQCTLTSSVSINEPPSIIFDQVGAVNPLCANTATGLIDVSASSGQGVLQYLLQPGGITQNSGVFTQLLAGIYTVTVSDAKGCTISTLIELPSMNSLTIREIEVTLVGCGKQTTNTVSCVTEGGSPPYTFTTIPKTDTNYTGVFNNLSDGDYQLMVSDMNGCTLLSPFSIQPKDCCAPPFVANAFTPNKDGVNDELHLMKEEGIRIQKFMIANRFGNIVFAAQNGFDRWNGHYAGVDCDAGTYYYFVEYYCEKSKEYKTMKGDVMLIR